MYVCICKSVTEHTVTSLVENGFSVKEIEDFTGASTCCGSCSEHLNDLVATGIEKVNIDIIE